MTTTERNKSNRAYIAKHYDSTNAKAVGDKIGLTKDQVYKIAYRLRKGKGIKCENLAEQKKQRAYVLKHFNGHNHAELADKLDLPRSSIIAKVYGLRKAGKLPKIERTVNNTMVAKNGFLAPNKKVPPRMFKTIENKDEGKVKVWDAARRLWCYKTPENAKEFLKQQAKK